MCCLWEADQDVLVLVHPRTQCLSVFTTVEVQSVQLVRLDHDSIWTIIGVLKWLFDCIMTYKNMRGCAEGAVNVASYL